MPNEERPTNESKSAAGANNKDLVKSGDQSASQIIQLGKSELDMTGLTEHQQQELRAALVKGAIEVDSKARQVALGTQALDNSLGILARHTKEVAREDGLAVTITNTREDAMGRTEVIIGNTETAAKGKLSRTQTGSRDLTLLWFALGVLVIIAIVIIAVAKH